MSAAESASLAAWQESPTGRAVYAALAQHVVTQIQASGLRPERLVSVGEGHGRLARELAIRLPETRVLGTDLCPKVVAAASASFHEDNLSYRVASAYSPGDLEAADVVVCAMSFHHFDDPRRALDSMWRCVRRPGLLYLVDLRRNATTSSYKRRLADYELVAPVVAALFRQSVAAAYTTQELEVLLRPFLENGNEHPCVRAVQLGLGAKQAYLAAGPDPSGPSWPEVVVDTGGLWVEAVLERQAP